MQIAPDEKARAAISKHGIKTSCNRPRVRIDNGGKKKRSDLSPTVTKRHSLRSGFIISRSTRALFRLSGKSADRYVSSGPLLLNPRYFYVSTFFP